LRRQIAGTTIFSSCLGLGLAYLFRPGAYPPLFEGLDYFHIAQGNTSGIETYYAGRVLHPLVVRWIAGAFHEPLNWNVFWWVAIGSLVALFAFMGLSYALDHPVHPWIALPLVATAVLIEHYRDYYWHDLFYTALCAAFFLVLRANRWASLPFLYLLYVTRESTIVLVAAVVIAAAGERAWKFCAGATLAGFAGFQTTHYFVARAAPSHHGISMALLDALKIPYNIAYNIFGLEFWTNTSVDYVGEIPKWAVKVPAWLPLGNIHEVGFYAFVWHKPIELLVVLASAFGVLPLLIPFVFDLDQRRKILNRIDLQIAFIYGMLAFLLTPLIGTVPARYILYAWPLFWIVGVRILFRVVTDSRDRAEFVALCVVASWLPAIVWIETRTEVISPLFLVNLEPGALLISLVGLVVIYARTFFLLRAQTASTS